MVNVFQVPPISNQTREQIKNCSLDSSIHHLPYFGIEVLTGNTLENDFYQDSCLQAQDVRSTIHHLCKKQSSVAPALLRLLFHDSFILGCDASILLEGVSFADILVLHLLIVDPFFDPSIFVSPSPLISLQLHNPMPVLDSIVMNFDFQDPMVVLESSLTNLGFQELHVAVVSWNGSLTIFAPTDNSTRSCGASCSVLQQHIVPGIFSPDDYLKKLAFCKKLETLSTGRCMTVTSASSRDENDTIVYIGGVEITQPDFFYNDLLVVHRFEGFINPFSLFSRNMERMTPLSFHSSQSENQTNTTTPSPAIMCLMLKDATVEFGGMGGSGTGTLYDSAAAVGDPAIFKTKGFADYLGMGSCAASDKGCVVEAVPAPKRHKEIW